MANEKCFNTKKGLAEVEGLFGEESALRIDNLDCSKNMFKHTIYFVIMVQMFFFEYVLINCLNPDFLDFRITRIFLLVI